MEAEEFLRHRGWGATLHLLRDVEDYGKLMYNQALEDVIEKIEEHYIGDPKHYTKIDKQSILKLKKL